MNIHITLFVYKIILTYSSVDEKLLQQATAQSEPLNTNTIVFYNKKIFFFFTLKPTINLENT